MALLIVGNGIMRPVETWEFPKTRGTLFGVLIIKDLTI